MQDKGDEHMKSLGQKHRRAIHFISLTRTGLCTSPVQGANFFQAADHERSR